jgi:16S rRNA (uracil1498-N3)-methyltransferase
MKAGERFILLDGKGVRFQVVIHSVQSREVLVRLEKPIPTPRPSSVTIILCQALLKSRPMDYLIQKTSELGVDRILPFHSERTITVLEGKRLSSRMRHWREVAQNAAKQSDRDMPATIGDLHPLKELVKKSHGQDCLKVILWEDEGSKDLKGLLKSSPSMKTFKGIVGPEGGFAPEEIEMAGSAGYIPVSLGKRVLRSETAAITMVAIVQYELGDLSLMLSPRDHS